MYYLKPKKINITVGNKYIVIINSKTATEMDIHPADRIQIINGHHEAIAIVDTSPIIKAGEIGLYVEAWNKLHVKRGDKRVSIGITKKPDSVKFIKEKLEGKRLSKKKIATIISDIVHERLSNTELTYFVAAIQMHHLNEKEIVNLTKVIAENGEHISFKNKIVLDKHCIGGVPGNRTTLITVPICAAAGLTVPKTSSRAITSPSGTADTLEVLTNITNSTKQLKKIAEKVGAFMTWGGDAGIAAADDYLIKVRNPLSLDPQGMLLASILAKKYSVSATHIIIDIPKGPDVKIKTEKEATKLGIKFKKIASHLGMKLKYIITDGRQPIGNGIGPILEAIDVIKVLKNEADAPKDLRNKSLLIAGEALELVKMAPKGKGFKMAEQILVSGKAYKKFLEIINAQGRKKVKLIPGKHSMQILSTKKGTVKSINNTLISHYARMAGAPTHPAAGIFILKKIGDKVSKKSPLFTIYSQNKTRLKQTLENVDINKCYQIE